MKQFWIQVVALLIVAFGAIILTFNAGLLPNVGQSTSANTNSSSPSTGQLKIGQDVLNVEIADTQAKRQLGLGGRDNLATDSGMLFVFSDTDKHSFWMKDVHFSLDFVWILDNKVVDVTQNVPPPAPDQSVSSLPIYESNSPINKVLEVNGGYASSHNIQVGDSITLIGS